MPKVDFLIFNAEVVTCRSNGKPKKGPMMQDLGIISDGAVAIKDGRIVAVGKTDEICRFFNALRDLDARGSVVSPGFVECHTHLIFAGDRLDEFEMKVKGIDYMEILAAGGGILSTVRQTRKATLKDLTTLAQKRLEKISSFGVTTCEIKTGYGLDLETEMRMLKAILQLKKMSSVEVVPTFMPAHAIPTEFNHDPENYVEIVCKQMLPEALGLLHKNSITTFFVDVFCEKNAFNLAQSKKILETAKQLGFRLKAHVDEFTNLGCASLAISLGATSIDHLDKTSDAEIDMLSKSNTIGVVTPTVNLNLGLTEFANARKLIDSGCAVAISTDYNPGSSPCPSIMLAMAVACRYQKLLPSEVFNAATINAAFALDLGYEIGSIEVGKRADLLVFDTKDYREIIYELGANPIKTIFKSGQVVTLTQS